MISYRWDYLNRLCLFQGCYQMHCRSHKALAKKKKGTSALNYLVDGFYDASIIPQLNLKLFCKCIFCKCIKVRVNENDGHRIHGMEKGKPQECIISNALAPQHVFSHD